MPGNAGPNVTAPPLRPRPILFRNEPAFASSVRWQPREIGSIDAVASSFMLIPPESGTPPGFVELARTSPLPSAQLTGRDAGWHSPKTAMTVRRGIAPNCRNLGPVGQTGEFVDDGRGRAFPCEACGADLAFHIGDQGAEMPLLRARQAAGDLLEHAVIEEQDYEAMSPASRGTPRTG